MKKSLARKITLSILAGAVLMSSSVVWADENPDVEGWNKDSAKYVWKGVSGGAPNGEVNGTSHAFTRHFYGAYDSSNGATGGKVTISAGTFNGTFQEIVGGYSSSGNATDNTVNISNGNFASSIYGGETKEGSAKNNTVNISDGDFANAPISGGCVTGGSGSAKANTVNVSDGKFEGYTTISGGCVTNGNGNAAGNTVNISGGKFGGSTTISSGYSYDSNAKDNIVNISGGDFEYTLIYGGETKEGSAKDNTVNIDSGNFKSVHINGGRVTGGSDNAIGNTVNISGGKFTGISKIIGGYDTISMCSAKDNIVNISGGNFGDANSSVKVFGGIGKNVENNTINISGNVDLENVHLYGAADDESGNLNSYGKGNKLNIDGWSGTVNIVNYFNNINFENVEWDSEQSNAVMEVTATLGFENDTTVTVGDMTNDSGANPKVGDEMTLIESTYAIYGNIQETTSKFKIGSFLRAQGKIYQDSTNEKINLELTKVSANEAILAFGESRAAASALTNQGSELIETGLDALARDNDKDTKVFAALYGNASEYETGSHVKVNGWNGIVGVGKTNANGVTMGAFFENGEGNYRTFNEYEGEFMRGDGEATYNGGGFLYRKDTDSGVYTEASLRAGNLQNELRNAVIAGDELVGYDIDTFYYGAHVGIGKVIPRGNEGDSIDVYGKFIYTHYDDEDFTVDGGKFHLDSIESERLRLGFRINEVQNNKLNMYYGAAWEYEFGGDSNNSVVGYDVDVNAPSLEGSTVIGEIGMHYKASEKWSIDLNGRAYVGQREGFSGSVQANYSF